MKVLELEGYKSLKALNVFHTLMLGLKMLPSYVGEDYQEFFDKVQKMEPKDQEKLLREAALFVELDESEVEALLCFCTDANGVPYDKSNLAKMKPNDIFEMIIAVCKEIAKIKVDFVSDSEKKN